MLIQAFELAVLIEAWPNLSPERKKILTMLARQAGYRKYSSIRACESVLRISGQIPNEGRNCLTIGGSRRDKAHGKFRTHRVGSAFRASRSFRHFALHAACERRRARMAASTHRLRNRGRASSCSGTAAPFRTACSVADGLIPPSDAFC